MLYMIKVGKFVFKIDMLNFGYAGPFIHFKYELIVFVIKLREKGKHFGIHKHNFIKHKVL